MRHRKTGVKLNRTSSHRLAMFRNMVTSLLKHDRIKTTEAKAKELRRWADHIVTLAKRGDLHARRQAMSILREKDVVHKIFEEASQRFGSINGGYTRIVRIGRRAGDAAPLTIIEMVSADGVMPGKSKKKPNGEVKPTAADIQAGETKAPAAAPMESPPEPAPQAAGEVEAASVDPEAEAFETEESKAKDSKAGTESGDSDK